MREKGYNRNAFDISEEEYRALCKQPGAKEVLEAVRKYNDLVSQSRRGEDSETHAFLSKEAEETKIFLDGLFDLAEKNR
jgi:hypothetical protein